MSLALRHHDPRPVRAIGGRRRRLGAVLSVRAERDAGALRRAIGDGGAVLAMDPSSIEEGQALVVDADACWLDGKPLVHPEAWWQAATTGRIGDVAGAFAVVWWHEGAMHVLRDPVGHRPLYLARLEDGWAIASSVGALIDAGLVMPELRPDALATFLTFSYVPGRPTLFDGVEEVPPGTHVVIEPRGVRWGPGWEPPAELDDGDADGLGRQLRRRLDVAADRLVPDEGPIGASLSGGVDSSLVVALTARRRPDIRTYALSFGDRFPNELRYSAEVARYCTTRHRVVELSPRRILDRIDDAAMALSSPIGDPLTVPNLMLFEEVSAEVDVLMNGEGGDPLFGGPKNLPMVVSSLYGSGDRRPDIVGSRSRAYLHAHHKCYDDLERMLAPAMLDVLASSPVEDQVAEAMADTRRSFVGTLMAINLRFKGAHHILAKVDQLSASANVMPRSPLFDRAVVEFANRLPAGLKLAGSTEKYLLKEAVQDMLPWQVIERPKSGMRVPVEAWFTGRQRRWARERLLDGLAPYGLFRRDYLQELLPRRGPSKGRKPGAKIWMLLFLEAWMRTHRVRSPFQVDGA